MVTSRLGEKKEVMGFGNVVGDEYDLRKQSIDRIGKILDALTECEINTTDNLDRHFTLLNVLVSNISPFMSETEREETEKFLGLIRAELLRSHEGKRHTFLHLARKFESELQTFILTKVKTET